eukprot:428573_1
MSYNETVPDFQIVRNKKKKLQCNICKQRFKVPQLSRDNEASHIGSNRHQAALTTITNAIQQRNRNRNILFGLLRRAAPQHQQTEVINAIASLRVEGQENMTLEQIIKQKHLDFYDIYALAVAKIQRVHPFYFAYEYFISKQPANVFSEREGHMGNLIRDKLAMKMGIQLFDNHLKGYFNLPDDITTEKHKVHIKNLSWLWRYVVRGHDVEKPNDLAKKLD